MAKTLQELSHYGKVIKYPCGVMDIICSSKADFREPGWEALAERPAAPASSHKRERDDATVEDLARSMRRARANVRRLALANDFRWFVTLTLDPAKIDRYDPSTVVRKVNQWCSNQVKRRDLRYILVPERHKDGALHFHGFFNDALEAVASGHTDKKGNMIYNLPGWALGFTAAIEVYGDYPAAVAYVCKYIGKQGDKPAGRWYYSGGSLQQPEVTYAEIGINDLKETYGSRVFETLVPGRMIAIVNGIKEDEA